VRRSSCVRGKCSLPEIGEVVARPVRNRVMHTRLAESCAMQMVTRYSELMTA
jgi:hypothetical protein